jgi:hypothetical protein
MERADTELHFVRMAASKLLIWFEVRVTRFSIPAPNQPMKPTARLNDRERICHDIQPWLISFSFDGCF